MIQSSQPSCLKLTKNLCLQHWPFSAPEQSSARRRTLLIIVGSVCTTRNGRCGSFFSVRNRTASTRSPHPEQSTNSRRCSFAAVPDEYQVRTVAVRSNFCQPSVDSDTGREAAISVYSSNSCRHNIINVAVLCSSHSLLNRGFPLTCFS